MLSSGPPLPAFQARLRVGLEQLRSLKRDLFVEKLRELNEVAASRLNAGRNSRMIDQARTTLGYAKQRHQPLPNRAVAELLGISKAAVTNFRRGRETSRKIQTFFESLFHWCHQPTITPRLTWHYTRQITIESLLVESPASSLSFATFLKVHFLATQLDRWSLLQAETNGRELQKLENHAGVQAVHELGPLLNYAEHLEATHLQHLVPEPNVRDQFLNVGPFCLAFDIRVQEIFQEVSK